MIRAAFAALAASALLTRAVAAPLPARTETLALPCALDGNTVRLRLRLGRLARGTEISVRSESGEPIGTASPYGLLKGQEAGTYDLRLRPGLFRDGRITVRLSARHFAKPLRAPSADEVREVKIFCVPARR